MSEWYANFNPIAFELFGLKVYWYGIAYIFALLSAFYLSCFFLRERRFKTIERKSFEEFFIMIELGILLGARIGYVLIYSPQRWEYLTHPWLIFNPFSPSGEFIGISGMSYHGGIIGFLIVGWLYARIKKISFLKYLDVIALGVPLAYIFGRIGNFLNHELFGRPIAEDNIFWKPFGIVVNGVLRYPSQLIEAFLEGLVVFIIVFSVRKKFLFDGALISIYAMSYACMRFLAEFFREADVQMGYYWGLSAGQILSMIMFVCGFLLFVYARNAKIAI